MVSATANFIRKYMNLTNPFILSFEFYPPKTVEGHQNLKRSAFMLDKLSPDFFSVTFGAGGSTREGTIEIVNMLKQETHTPIAPHISCIGFNKEALCEILHQ